MTKMDTIVNNSNAEVLARLSKLGLALPGAPHAPIGSFLNAKRVGNLLYISGQGPVAADGKLSTGKVGAEIGTAQAHDDARLVGINILAVILDELGDFSRVKQVVKLLGMVNAVPDFDQHPAVINGCSNMLFAVLGEAGRHARSAVGVASLPNNITVEIEAIIEVE